LYILLLTATFIAICLTFSRSALLMLVVSGITFFLLIQKKKYIFALLGIIIIFAIIISPYFYLENINLFRHESSVERLGSIGNALTIIRDHPFLGVGFDAYRYAQIKYHFVKPTHTFPSNAESGADTSLLFAFATTGILGLGAYCFLWYKLLGLAYKEYKVNPFALIFFVSGIGILFNSLFINSLFYTEIMMWFWMIAALMYKK
jgi:O-antigen ligase